MGFLDDLGKNIADGLQNLGKSLQEQLDIEKLEYNKNIFLKDVILDKKYNFNLKVEEDKLTFTNFSASSFVRTLHNSPLFMILLCIAMLSIIMLVITNGSKFTSLFMVIFVATISLTIFIFTFFRTKAYFTITPQGVELKTNKSRVFIDRDNIADIYLDVHNASNDRVVTSDSKDKHNLIIFSVYLKSSQSVHLSDLKKDKDIFDFFVSDYRRLSQLFVVVFLNEAKRILNLPKQNEFFGNGFKNVNVLKDDGSEFVFEKKGKLKITVTKYQVKIEENGFLGNKIDKGFNIQNTSSFRIFEDIKQKCRVTTSVSIGGVRVSHRSGGYNMFRENNDFGLALFNDVSANKPDIIVNGMNLDEAVYIYRKLNALR